MLRCTYSLRCTRCSEVHPLIASICWHLMDSNPSTLSSPTPSSPCRSFNQSMATRDNSTAREQSKLFLRSSVPMSLHVVVGGWHNKVWSLMFNRPLITIFPLPVPSSHGQEFRTRGRVFYLSSCILFCSAWSVSLHFILNGVEWWQRSGGAKVSTTNFAEQVISLQ